MKNEYDFSRGVRGKFYKASTQTDKLQETQDALSDIEASRTIDGNTVMEWLDSWGTEKEKPL